MQLKTRNPKIMLLKGFFYDKDQPKYIAAKVGSITENINKNVAFAYLGKAKSYDEEIFKKVAAEIIKKAPREYQIDVESFTASNVSERLIVNNFVHLYNFDRAKLFSLKTQKTQAKPTLELVNVKEKKVHNHAEILSQAVNYTRDLQITPPNVMRSTDLANRIKKDFQKHPNVKVTVLDKSQIQKLKMGLLLSVNAGSAFDARVVILEYNGAPSSKKTKTVLVGKGIMFDSGGMNLKPSLNMLGMKFDMSGSAVVAGVMKAVATLKPKTNVAGLMMITDNMISPFASTADSVFTSMNGKTVEVNNTDAEGRLVLADGITYAIEKLKATRVVDIATLTGAILISLGDTYTGAWASSDRVWEDLYYASQDAHELVWRMPFHENFAKNIRQSLVADLKNVDYKAPNKGNSCSAAMFLKEFAQDSEFLHLDIAGTAQINEVPQAPMVRTLYEMVSK
ncbi:leucyl aminopeptidase family protein [Mycoplasma sp. ATU-Cv-703]|uniref:leucyl aminopeptidase family protein n=1 Tax=Mycoplasma sp. ATU-Cv-703 TaxID=2498595 RepID=UPI000FDE8C4A